MSATTTISRPAPTSAQTTRTRALAIAVAAVAAFAVWVVAVPLLGGDLRFRFGHGAVQTVEPAAVVAGTIVASLLGWAVLAVLEKRSRRAARIWTGIAVAALLVSLIFPIVAGIATSTKITLILMHLAVAAVVIPALRHSSPRS